MSTYTFNIFKPNLIELEYFKSISSQEFYAGFPNRAKYFLETCNLYLKNEKLLIATLKAGNELAVSCLILIKEVNILGKPYDSAMISLVMVQNEFRGKGLLYRFFNEINFASVDLAVSIQFIVARKKVDYMYNKFGFVGFSNFPIFELNKNTENHKPYTSFKKFIPDMNELVFDLTKSHSRNALVEPLFFHRSNEFWAHILKNGVNELMLDSFLDTNGVKFYIFHQGASLLEIQSVDQIDSISLNQSIQYLNLQHIKIGLHNPCTAVLDKFKWRLKIRPTPHGGHMIRMNDDVINRFYIHDKNLNKIHSWCTQALKNIDKIRLKQSILLEPVEDYSFSIGHFDEF